MFGAMLVMSVAQARDTHLKLPIKDAMATADYQAKVDQNIKLFFGAQEHPKPAQSFGTIKTNKKTNFFNKSDKEGCEWVFLSAILALQEAARQRGGDAAKRSGAGGSDLKRPRPDRVGENAGGGRTRAGAAIPRGPRASCRGGSAQVGYRSR